MEARCRTGEWRENAAYATYQQGIPKNSPQESPDKVAELQNAIADILKSTRLGEMPDKHSVRVFQRYLNMPTKVIPYSPPSVYWKEDESESGSVRIVAFDFEEGYLRHVAGLLKRCLDECFSEIFLRPFSDDIWLVGICPICQNLFLKAKSNQICCSTSCFNRFAYRQRIGTEKGKEKSREKNCKSYKRSRENQKKALARKDTQKKHE